MNIGVASPRVLMRKSLCALLAQVHGFRVVLDLDNPFEQVELLRKSPPDIMLIDAVNPTGDLDVVSRLRTLVPSIRILLFSDALDEDYQVQAIRKGVQGFVSKTCEPAMLEKALKLVARGEMWVGRNIATRIIGKFMRSDDSRSEDLVELSRREREILALLADGHRNKAIGNLLGISENTIRVHLLGLYKKIGVDNRLAAALYFLTKQGRNGNGCRPDSVTAV